MQSFDQIDILSDFVARHYPTGNTLVVDVQNHGNITSDLVLDVYNTLKTLGHDVPAEMRINPILILHPDDDSCQTFAFRTFIDKYQHTAIHAWLYKDGKLVDYACD